MSVVRMAGWDQLPANNTYGLTTILQRQGWYGDVDILGTAPGAFGYGNCLRFVNNISKTVYWALGQRFTEDLIVGMRIYVDASADILGVSAFDGITSTTPFTLRFESLGRIFLRNSAGTTVARTRTGVFNEQTWIYIQYKVHFDGASGTFELLVNGETVLSVTGNFGSALDTMVWSVSSVATNPSRHAWDDFYLLKDDGVGQSDYLGNVTVGASKPNAAGDLTDFTPFGLPTNWQNAADVLVNDARYNFSQTVGDKDLYNLEATAPSREIFAIQVAGSYKQTDSLQLYAKNIMKTGGVEFEGAQNGVAQVYKAQWDIWEKNPNTTVDWTDADLAALQIGPYISDSD